MNDGSHLGTTTAARAAELAARYYRHFDDPELPVPVDAIAVDLLGLSVEEADSLDVSGMLIPSEKQIWLNGLESRSSEGRRRFTLAHEVGHWICQYQQGQAEPRYCRSGEIGQGAGRNAEREANAFAADLLMPAPLVELEAARLKLNTHALANRFKVSPAAMRIRLVHLSLLPEYMK